MKLKREILSKDEAGEKVFDYVPKQFPLKVFESASQFATLQKDQPTGFKINDLNAQQSGVAHLSKMQMEAQIEAEALEKLKDIQERAYKEAYELGVIEGSEKAFNERKNELAERIEKLDALLMVFENIKLELVSKNEAQLVKLLNLMAEKIAMNHIETNKDIIVEVIRQVIEAAQTDEDVQLQVSSEDHMFIESLREKINKKTEFLKRVKLETSDEIKSGGCILQTKYGAIDATIEQRLNKVWEAVESKIPQIRPDAEQETPISPDQTSSNSDPNSSEDEES